MLSRRNGLKAAIALPFATMLPAPEVQADEVLTFEERAAALIGGASYDELLSLAYLSIDIAALRVTTDVPHAWTTTQALATCRVDMPLLAKWASHISHHRIVDALAEHVSQ